MVDEREWEWVVDHADVECEHLILATSVPVAMPGGLHDLERWNEKVCNGAWGKLAGRFGEKIRRAVDLEDWSAFHDSYVELIDLVRRVATPRGGAPTPPATVTILSGDVHFSYRARATFVDEPDQPAIVSRIHQIVNSPIRNVLRTRERRVLRLGLSKVGELVGRGLRRTVGSAGLVATGTWRTVRSSATTCASSTSTVTRPGWSSNVRRRTTTVSRC